MSNENDDAVYFDNFAVSYTRGRIIEENHYYAFGLRIAGISSRKYYGGMEGSLHGGQALKNGYLYQGDFAELDEDIGWTDFELRNYDAQTGRWIQQDPFQQFASPYTGMGNDPVALADPSGGWAATGLFQGMNHAAIMAATTVGGAIIGGAVDLLSGGDGGKGFLIGAGVGLASNFSLQYFVSGSLNLEGEDLSNAVRNSEIKPLLNPYAFYVGGHQNNKLGQKIANLANSKADSHDWDFWNSKDNFPPRWDKCNKFVFDILNEAGASPGTPNGWNPFSKYPPTAGQWADPHYYIPGWRILLPNESARPGDVVAQSYHFSNGATGHVGIVFAPGVTISQESKPIEIVGKSNFGFRTWPKTFGRSDQVLFRRFVPLPPSKIQYHFPNRGMGFTF